MSTHFASHTPCPSSSREVDVDDDHQDDGGNVGNGDDNEEDVDGATSAFSHSSSPLPSR